MRQPLLFRVLDRPVIPAAAGLAVIAIVALGLILRLPSLDTTRRPEPQFDKLVVTAPLTRDDVTLTATKADAFGVAGDTRFILKSKTPLEVASVEQALAIAPSVPFSVDATSDTEFEITPRATLSAGTVYRIALGSTVQQNGESEKQALSWAFQARPTFRVDGTLPRHRATGVPIDTGIEVTFSTNRYDDVERFITLSPDTPGRFERHGRVVAFVPKERLQAGTLYTLTVKQGLPVQDSATTLANDLVVQFETATEIETSYYGNFSQAFTGVRPGEAPVLAFQVYGDRTARPDQATLYRFRDANELLERLHPIDTLPQWAYGARARATVSTDGLTRVGEFALTAEADALHFPRGFDAGYYLVEVRLGNRTLQTPLVVSDLAASTTVTRTETIVWVYDLATGRPVRRATVTGSIDDVRATTDDQGLARVPTFPTLLAQEPTQSRAYYTIEVDGQTTLVPIAPTYGWGWGASWRWGNDTSRHWVYLWTDRTLYRPTDTINSWGVVKPRPGEGPLNLDLELWTWNWVDAEGNYVPLAKAQARTNDTGAFSASLPLVKLKPGYYTLSLKVDGRSIASRSVEVRTFQKPAYRIVATPSAIAGFDGDDVTIDVRTEFFDGTPAPEVKLKWGTSWGEFTEELTTNSDGRATLRRELTAEEPFYPSSNMYRFAPAVEVEGQVEGETSILVYPAAVIFEPRTTREGSTGTVAFTLHEVELPTQPLSWWEQREGGNGAPVPNATIEGALSEIIVEKTKRGEHYDFIEKRVIDDYDYSQRKEERETFTGTTDAQGRFEQTVTLTGDHYELLLTATDRQGRVVKRYAYFYDVDRLGAGGSAEGYRVADAGAEGLSGAARRYAPGESTTLGFYHGNELVETRGAFLFIELQGGLRNTTIMDEPTLPFTMTQAHAPNVAFTVVWFDGTGFRAPEFFRTATLDFDERGQQLTIEVTQDRERYSPGDTAELTVRTTDRNGQPVRASVNLSAIDEAINTIQWENAPTPLESLYGWVPDGLLQVYVSTAPLRAELGAEGGGGGDGARKDFRDAPLFTDVQTNRDGEARVRFKLPDNLTSWRLTAQAVTEDLQAGHTVTAVVVTKPLFGTLTLADEFVLGDRPAVVARAYGTALSSDTPVSFRLETPGLGEPQVANGRAYDPQRFTLPTLTLGDHELKLTVTAGRERDALIRRFLVVPSRLTKATSRWLTAEPGLNLTGSETERTIVVVSDAGRGRIMSDAHGLAWSWGKRLERYLAARVAVDVLTEIDQTTAADPDFDPLAFQTDDGGLALVNYGSSELRLSAFAAARGDLFDAGALAHYFETKLADRSATSEQVGLALLGLAHLGRPVLADLDAFVASDGITDADRLNAAVAYQALGAQDKAAAIAQPLLERYGETQDPFIRLNLGDGQDAKIVNTAVFQILAEGLKLPQRLGLDRYLSENFPTETLTNLERALALKAAVPLLDDAPVTLRYRFQNQEQTITLERGKTQALSATPDELREFEVLEVQGPVALTVNSVAPLDPEREPRDTRLSINRRYSAVGRSGGSLRQGDIVRIDLEPRVARGVIDDRFLLTDVLPSGLRLLSHPSQRGFHERDLGYPYDVTGQRVTFLSSGRKAFHYYALVLMPGSFTAEPSVFQGEASRDLVNYSGAQTMEIR